MCSSGALGIIGAHGALVSLVRMARLVPSGALARLVCASRALYQLVRLRALYYWCAWRALYQFGRLRALRTYWCACAPCTIGGPLGPCIRWCGCAACVYLLLCLCQYWCAWCTLYQLVRLCVLCINSWRSEGAITLNEGDFVLCWITVTNSSS